MFVDTNAGQHDVESCGSMCLAFLGNDDPCEAFTLDISEPPETGACYIFQRSDISGQPFVATTRLSDRGMRTYVRDRPKPHVDRPTDMPRTTSRNAPQWFKDLRKSQGIVLADES